MIRLADLLARNREWAEKKAQEDSDFFKRLVQTQRPRFLWIGCADSRVPANGIVDTDPGEIVVHRNIANLVCESDQSVLSVLQYAIEVLRVEHVIVCGHYNCGGIQAALRQHPPGPLDGWLRPIQQLAKDHADELGRLEEWDKRVNRLCELNVSAQVANVAHTGLVQKAWKAGQKVIISGWIYHLTDGVLQDLEMAVKGPEDLLSMEATPHR